MTNDNSRHWAVLAPINSGPTLTAQAQQVEAAGLAGIFSPQLYSSPFMTLGHCAAVTERVQLATGVAIADARSPFETAMTAIDLDRLSDGRFVLGLGTSTRVLLEDVYGVPAFDKPLARLRETVELIRVIVAGADNGKLERFEGVYHRHDWSQFQGALVPSVRARIPIWIAAAQPRLTRLVGEIAEGFISHPIPAGRANARCRRCRKASGMPVAPATTSTGTPGTTWRSTPIAGRRSRTPAPPSRSTHSSSSTSACSPPKASRRRLAPARPPRAARSTPPPEPLP
jgi:alkanesulfonate monooxygenase SsuD/methylene tetrahydromethanopterin reductase-like flavin-dependent oxidoreductase (luciferase family)